MFDASISSVVEVDSTKPKEPHASPEPIEGPLSAEALSKMQLYWQAANYLTIGQIYLQSNPLLREPLRPEYIKPRLLGHWGTSPGLSFIYVHLNRLINEHNVDMIYLAGPWHGGPAIVANVYLEGTYSQIYPEISQDIAGMRRLFRQFSTPGGIPSHVSVTTPGSIHEGGELGYVLSHAYGAAFDNPDLIVVAVVGDGEAETVPLAGSWKGTSFLNPACDGAVLPILHLNGYKIAGPTVLGRSSNDEVRALIEGNGYEVFFVEGDDPARMHQQFAATLDTCYALIRAIQQEARFGSADKVNDGPEATRRYAPKWPAIVLRTPKGWTGPKEVGGLPVEGTFRAHQVPFSSVRKNREQMEGLEAWMRSYEPDKVFDDNGRLLPELAALAPRGLRRMGANPHANGGKLLTTLRMPDFRLYALDVPHPATERAESTRQLGKFMRDIFVQNADEANFRLFCPDEVHSNRLDNVFEVENRCFAGPTISIDDHVSPDGRVMEVLSGHLCEGWLEGYLLTGRHGLFATYEAFAMVSASMTVQHTKWMQEALEPPGVGNHHPGGGHVSCSMACCIACCIAWSTGRSNVTPDPYCCLFINFPPYSPNSPKVQLGFLLALISGALPIALLGIASTCTTLIGTLATPCVPSSCCKPPASASALKPSRAPPTRTSSPPSVCTTCHSAAGTASIMR
ncbi:MAG: phosphoketolase family protein [Chloroflexia bacterium]